MKVKAVVSASNGTGSGSMKMIQALDLSGAPEHRALWRAREQGPPGAFSPVAGLPSGGQASPMGYWLSAAEPAAGPDQPLRLTVRAQGEPAAQAHATEAAPRRARRPAQTVRIKQVNPGEGDLFLTIAPGQADVVASEAAWHALAEPVLLAVCQYWRFCTVDAQIDRLTDLAWSDLGHATLPSPASLRARKALAARAQEVRELLVDLTHFEGPLTDALPYCSSQRSAEVYESLAEKLNLEDWCEAIDERMEALEDTYEAVTEKLFEYRNFAWEALLETVIVVILLAELAVLAWEALVP